MSQESIDQKLVSGRGDVAVFSISSGVEADLSCQFIECIFVY